MHDTAKQNYSGSVASYQSRCWPDSSLAVMKLDLDWTYRPTVRRFLPRDATPSAVLPRKVVHPSVRVCLSRWGHTGWNTSKIFMADITPVCSLVHSLQTTTSRIYAKENTQNFRRNNSGVCMENGFRRTKAVIFLKLGKSESYYSLPI